MFLFSNKRIFISPLDWGLGHATRCVPIIKRLSEQNTVIIGVTELNRLFFERNFPALQTIEMPSYNIRYSSYWPVWLKVLLQWPSVKRVIREEKKVLHGIVRKNNIDVVISDNRFGLHHPEAETIFITHQLNIRSPFGLGIANRINSSFINHFDKVWVPDHEDKNSRLSGQLSDSAHIKIPVEFIGPQSALSSFDESDLSPEKSDYLFLLSGVEPQRTVLENALLEKFKNTPHKIVLVRGSSSPFSCDNKNVKVLDLAFGTELKKLITGAETVICRSGYSTLMDLHLLGKKKLILVPTPGQTEQEYLANYWQEKFSCRVIRQADILRAKMPGATVKE